MPRAGPRTVHRCSAVIHPFMLSKWRKDAREGKLRGSARKAPPAGPAREIAKLQALEALEARLIAA
ncbi:MAG: hypothetical protein ACR2GG_02835 [Gemmatimonadaceae bacterium]